MFQLDWKALTSNSWVLEMVKEGYHIPLISNPVQQTPHHPPLPTKYQISLEDEVKSLQHVHDTQRSETYHHSQISESICEIRTFQDGGPTHSQSSSSEE